MGAALVVAAGASLLLTACSNAGPTLAQQACVHVDTSIRLYTEAERTTNVAVARHKVTQATSQLEEALPLAARANSADPAFNPLMTTLQEIGRTSEANLIPALRAQCSAAQNPTTANVTPASGATGGGASTTPPGG